ncbi:MAG: hypothetical protein FWB75_05435 [Oscillospiraceae bacterium]|nr:hypothetical protein [Oscillospiraceae bacterium]
MKKTLKTILITGLVALVLIANVAIVADTASADTDVSLEERLIGTWRWVDQHSWIVVFREDGTMLDGPPGLRTFYNWMIVNDRLFVNGVDWNLQLTDDTMSLTRSGVTYLYVWYSDSTEGEANLLWLIIIPIVIVLIIVLVIVLLVRRSRKRRREMQEMQNIKSKLDGDSPL